MRAKLLPDTARLLAKGLRALSPDLTANWGFIFANLPLPITVTSGYRYWMLAEGPWDTDGQYLYLPDFNNGGHLSALLRAHIISALCDAVAAVLDDDEVDAVRERVQAFVASANDASDNDEYVAEIGVNCIDVNDMERDVAVAQLAIWRDSGEVAAFRLPGGKWVSLQGDPFLSDVNAVVIISLPNKPPDEEGA